MISVASHDSILPIDRVKLTRAVDISTNSTCMQLSAPCRLETGEHIQRFVHPILVCYEDGHYLRRDLIILPPTNAQWQPPLRISPPRNLSARTITHAHQSQTHRRDRTPVCLRRSCLQATAVEAQVARHASKATTAAKGVREIARDDGEWTPASETG